MIQAQLADGRVLEFPEGTDDSVINTAVKKTMGIGGNGVEGVGVDGMGIPEGGSPPISTIKPLSTELPTMPIGSSGPLPPTEPEIPLGKRIVEEIPQVGGGIVGGVAAGTVGAGLLPVVGAVSAGAAAGEAYKQIGQHLSGSLDAPKTSLDAAKRIGKAGLTEGGWELVGGLAVKGFGKIIAPLKNKIIKEGEEAIDMFKDKLKPIVLLPAEATESRILDLLQNVSESSIVGGASIQEFKTRRTKFFDDFADSLIDEFGNRTDPTDLGNLFVTSINNSKAVHSKAAKVLYNSVKAGRAKTEIKSIKNFARPLQKRAVKLEGIEAKNAGDDLVGAIMDLPDKLSYKEATELRSRLISRIDEFSILNKKAPAIGKAKKMVGMLDKAIEKSLKGVNTGTGKSMVVMNKRSVSGVGNITNKYAPNLDDPGWKFSGKLYRAGPIKGLRGREGGTFFSVIREDAEQYGDDVMEYTVKSLGKIKHLDIENSYSEIAKRSGIDLSDVGGDELIEAVEKIIPQYKKEGFDSIVIDGMPDLGDMVPVQVVVFDEKSLKVIDTPVKNGKTKKVPTIKTKWVMGYDGKPVLAKVVEDVEIGPLFAGMREASKQEVSRLNKLINNTAKGAEEKLEKSGWNVIETRNIDKLKKKEGFFITMEDAEDTWFKKISTPRGKIPSIGESPAIPAPLEAWRTANRFYKDGQKKFNNTLIRRLVKLADDTGTGAEMIATTIFKPRHISSVRKIKTALKDDPKTWRKLQGFFMQHIMQKSADVNGEIVGKKIINSISGKPGSFGLPMLKEVFTDKQIKSLRVLGETIKLTRTRRAEGAGKVLIQLTQAGALGTILTGNLSLPAATIIIAPAVMSKMMLNPRITKLFTTGLTLPARSPEAAGVLARLTSAAWRVQNNEGNGDEGEYDETTK